MYCVAGAIGPRAYEELYTACNLVPCEDTHAALLAADAPLADLFADWERAAGAGEPLLPVPCVRSCCAGAGVCLPLLRRITPLRIRRDAARRVSDSIDGSGGGATVAATGGGTEPATGPRA